jgi:uncharacterized protein (DUF1015 family)
MSILFRFPFGDRKRLLQSSFFTLDMADIAPFRALRYDPQRVPLDRVVTQPYDKITPAMQEDYYSASPYNLVRVILGKSQPGDSEGSNTYSRAAASSQNWRKDGVLVQDPEPSLYRYTQTFHVPASAVGQAGHERIELERLGFIAAGRIHDYGDQVVFRHEQTLSKPKSDRLNLLRATRAHFGQIFMLYSDPGSSIDSVLASSSVPDACVTDEYGVVHRLWRVSDPAAIRAVQQKMGDKKLIIADGHHRYETALNYRNERRAASGSPDPNAPYERVMMTFVNMDAPGLVILPTHRVVFGLKSFDLSPVLSAAQPHFETVTLDNSAPLESSLVRLREEGRTSPSLLIATRQAKFILRARLGGAADALLPQYTSAQRQLDVVQLHKVLLENVLGLSEESIRNQENLAYVREAAEAVDRVQQGEAQIAFLMNPCRMEQVRDIAFAGGVLPQKSTDFYPKLLSGLTIYALD